MSKRDQKVLDLLFRPDASFEDGQDEERGSADSSLVDMPKDLLESLTKLEVQGVEMAEKGDLDGALALFNSVLETEPTFASVYNNRAQLHRLRSDPKSALSDVENAINFARGDRLILRQAYTQRAILRKEAGDEVGAEADFAKGASFGNQLAKHMVKQNPYAKMCNAMVTEMLAAYKP